MLSKLLLSLALRNRLLRAAAVAAVIAHNYGTMCCVLFDIWRRLLALQPQVAMHTGEYPLAATRAAFRDISQANTHNLITAYAIDEATRHSSGRNGRAQTAS